MHSGIQNPHGGVARYYRSDSATNAPVSTEITGYAASTLTYLHSRTGKQEYLDAAVRAARYLTDRAWDSAASTFPFEPGSDRAYFFDIGIIVRGLLAVWRATGEEEFHARAQEATLSMAFDFLGDGSFHPVISLPDKQPLPEEPRWSRQPGCYQLKSALAWREIGDPHARQLFDAAVAFALTNQERFLEEEKDREKLMDRLHAYCYFLEALLFTDDARDVLASGIARVGQLLREISPSFERSDVNAQLLRVRLVAQHLGAVPLDEGAAREEAASAASFQACDSADVSLRGGFWFGRKGTQMLPFSNPVSTAFCLQALALWDDHQAERWNFGLQQLI
ncbi:MAG: hypothetical protein ACRD4E_11970 [Bryobacteraceae bacterium]